MAHVSRSLEQKSKSNDSPDCKMPSGKIPLIISSGLSSILSLDNMFTALEQMALHPPPDWGIEIGTIAHNLRSALNQLVYQLVYQLALLNKPAKTVAGDYGTQFPIFLFRERRAGKFRSRCFNSRGRSMIRLLKLIHQALIERLQPYNRGNNALFKSPEWSKYRGRNSPLFWLEQINNADKHRLIQVVSVKIGAGPMIAWWGDETRFPNSSIRLVILKDGAKFGEFPKDVHVDSEVLPLIAFANCGCQAIDRKGVIFILKKILLQVEFIIELFASEFYQ